MLDLESPFFRHRICSCLVYFGGRNISFGCTPRTLNQQTPRKKYILRNILSFDTGICGKMSVFWRKHTSLLPLPLVCRYKNSETGNPLLRYFLDIDIVCWPHRNKGPGSVNYFPYVPTLPSRVRVSWETCHPLSMSSWMGMVCVTRTAIKASEP